MNKTCRPLELLQLRERQLAQGHADSRRQVELRMFSVLGDRSDDRTKLIIESASVPTRRRPEDRRLLQELHGRDRHRSEGPLADQPALDSIAKIQGQGRRDRRVCNESRHLTRARSTRKLVRTTAHPRRTSRASPGRTGPSRPRHVRREVQAVRAAARCYKKYVTTMFTLIARRTPTSAPPPCTPSRRRSPRCSGPASRQRESAEDLQQADDRAAQRTAPASSGSSGSKASGSRVRRHQRQPTTRSRVSASCQERAHSGVEGYLASVPISAPCLRSSIVIVAARRCPVIADAAATAGTTRRHHGTEVR